jgi:autotransporter-associated beta strand protein
MAAITWKNPVSGDWDVASNWSTDTVPTSADDVTISGTSPFSVTISCADEANSLTLNGSLAALIENTGSLTMAGALTVDAGLASLNQANTIGSVTISGGVVAFGNAGALGSGAVSVAGGELLSTTNQALANPLIFSGTSTIAAARGTTLTENASSYVVASGASVNIGTVAADGVIDWMTNDDDVNNLHFSYTVNVNAGTLVAGDANLSLLIGGPHKATVEGGATVDLNGFSTIIQALSGAGAIINSGAAATLDLDSNNTFLGSISGPLSVIMDGAQILGGANSYTGSTTIDQADLLQLGLGGATGSIGGGAISIGLEGNLAIDRNNAVALTNSVSGVGALQQIGTGVTSINTANSYSGGTTISAGTLAIGNGAALGGGTVTLKGGELLGTATETVGNPIAFSPAGGTTTLAAADGTVLTLTGNINVATGGTIDIGAPGQDGQVTWSGEPAGIVSDVRLDVLGGLLAAGSSGLSSALADFVETSVQGGATLDWSGETGEINNLRGSGVVTNTGVQQTLVLAGQTKFSGALVGALSVRFEGDASLAGSKSYSGDTILDGPITVMNSGTYGMVACQNIEGSPASSFINGGLFDKTGGGVSDVTSNFVNNGALNVLSGSISFSGGFTNNGVIHGLVTQSDGVTTISAAVPSDFTGAGSSDILWQSTNGQAAIWNMKGTGVVGGGPVSPNPGPNWKAVGSGDFNGDGIADILWQNANGQASIWEMNGNTVIGSGPVSPNPGPAWKAVGTGDFNGDGLADILWRDTSTGQASIWEMNRNTVIGGGPVKPGPGPGWEAVGAGDFDGDVRSDILWRNGDGQVAIWQMNGTQITGAGILTQNPGSSWQFVGTGDFNNDGFDDIVFQNRNSGQVSIWEMGGSSVNGGGIVSANPGASWRAVGVGDYYGDGYSDILFQNTSGQASIWEMNGTNIIAGGPVSPNPGSSWRAVPT